MRKALKTTSVQILIVGGFVCTLMAIVFMVVAWLLDFEGILTVIQIVVGAIAGGFSALVVGRKGRDIYQARNNTYYDEEQQKLLKVDDHENV